MKKNIILAGTIAAIALFASCGNSGSTQTESTNTENMTPYEVEESGPASNNGRIFTVTYADSYDGFVNLRSEPSNKGRVVAEMYEIMHGLGSGVLLDEVGGWCKIELDGKVGYAYSKYVGYQTWYTGKGQRRIVAAKDNMPIYTEDISGEHEYGGVFATVDKGTIIADEYEEGDGWIFLQTAHDALLIRRSDVRIEANTPIEIRKHEEPKPEVTRSRGIPDNSKYLAVVRSLSSKQKAINESESFGDLICGMPVWESIVDGKVVYRIAYGYNTKEEAKESKNLLIEEFGLKCWVVERTDTDIKVWEGHGLID